MDMYLSNITTGYTLLPVLAIRTSRYLLCCTLTFTSVSENCRSGYLICDISLKQKTPEKVSRQSWFIRISNNDANCWAITLTILRSSCGAKGSFYNRLPPFMWCALSRIVFTIGCDGDCGPPSSCAHARAFTASSTAIYASVVSSKCCRYNAIWTG